MIRSLKIIRPDVLLVCLLLLTFPLFFYKLSQNSLVSWDEAWYGGIAKNILTSGNFFSLSFNGSPYFDHPPAGFWIEALGEKIFGVNELGVRFFPATLGFLSLLILYFLGKEFFGRVVGFASALALSSATWFLFRARSGNLDTILTFLFLLTLLLAIKTVHDKRFLIPLGVSFTLLALTKSLIPFTIIPVLFLILWKTNYKFKDWIIPILIFTVLFGFWFLSQFGVKFDFHKHYLMIGTPGIGIETSYFENLKLAKEYLHSGIGKWFWPSVLALSGSLFLKQKRFYILTLFFLIFFIPFIFSTRGNIWHLIPLYPIMILSFFGFSFVILLKIFNSYRIVVMFILSFCVYLTFTQTRQNWYQFINISGFVSDEAILSKEAKKYPFEPLYIDGDFIPAAVFYSDKKVYQIWFDAIPELFRKKESLLLITKQERLDGAKISKAKYNILKTDRDRILVLKQ